MVDVAVCFVMLVLVVGVGCFGLHAAASDLGRPLPPPPR